MKKYILKHVAKGASCLVLATVGSMATDMAKKTFVPMAKGIFK